MNTSLFLLLLLLLSETILDTCGLLNMGKKTSTVTLAIIDAHGSVAPHDYA